MNESEIKEKIRRKLGLRVFDKSPLDAKALIDNSRYSDLDEIEESLDEIHKDDPDYDEDNGWFYAYLVNRTIAGDFFVTKKLMKAVKMMRGNQLLGGYNLYYGEHKGKDETHDEDEELTGEYWKNPEAKQFLILEAGLNDNSPDFFLAGLSYSPKPLSIVHGLSQTGKRKIALMLGAYGLERGYFDKVASNIETEEFDTIKSIPDLDDWLSGEGRRLFILGGADRYLGPKDKGTVIYRRFMKLVKKARDTGNKIWLIANERPIELKGAPKPLEEYRGKHEDPVKAWESDYSLMRKLQDLSPELDDGYTLACWIGTVGTPGDVKREILFDAHEETGGWDNEYLFSGCVKAFDKIGLEDFTPNFREDDPCDFFKEPPKKEETGGKTISPLDLELYLEHKEGKSFREMAKERELGRSAIHQRVKKVKEFRGEE